MRKLLDMEWDMMMIGGQPHAHVCPACGAIVPVGNDGFGVSRRTRHVDWHAGEAWKP